MAKILIAEDDAALSKMLKKKLELAEHEVRAVTDGEKALAAMRKEKPDLLLLDIIMPKMDGYEVLEAMQKDAELKDIPAIVLSNSGQEVELKRVTELGAKDYLIKAVFDPGEVVEKVNKHLSGEIKAPVKEESSPADSISPRSYSVLIIEDDKFLRDLLVLKLKKEGFRVSEAFDGEEGLKKTKSEKPNIIILDLIIPGIDGFAFLETVKKDPEAKDIPVIVLSNLGQREDIERAKALGARDYMVKAQLTPLEVVERIKEALREAYI